MQNNAQKNPPSESLTEQSTPSRTTTVKDERAQAFSDTMSQAQSHLSPLQRIFSRFIHTRVVATVSDVIGSTFARPIALLCGALAAILATLVLYGTAKYFGYSLSGSESLVAFGLGWLIGIIIEYTQLLLRGGPLKNKRS